MARRAHYFWLYRNKSSDFRTEAFISALLPWASQTLERPTLSFEADVLTKVLQVSRVWEGEGNGTPLWYCGLESPMDGGAWWAAVHGVAKSRALLCDFPFTFHFHALEKEMATHSSVLAWRIPDTEESSGLLSMGSHRVRHNWSDLAAAATEFEKRPEFENLRIWLTGQTELAGVFQLSHLVVF